MTFRARVSSLAHHLAALQLKWDSPSVIEITEGRSLLTVGDKRYSWCGDFITYVLMMAGARERCCLNRKATNGTWRIGHNINMLLQCARQVGASYEGTAAYKRLAANRIGDVVLLDSPGGGHVGFSAGMATSTVFTTWDGNWAGSTHITIRNVGAVKIAAVFDVDCYNAWLDTPRNPPPEQRPVPKPARQGERAALDPVSETGVQIGATSFGPGVTVNDSEYDAGSLA